MSANLLLLLSDKKKQWLFTNGVLPPGLTHARASNATLFDTSGKLTWAAANMALQSEFDYWSSAADTGGEVTLTKNYAAAPDATVTAARLDIYNPGAYALLQGETAALVSGRTYTMSIWVKSNTEATQEIQLILGNSVYANKVVTTEWQRVSFSGVANGTSYIKLAHLHV